MIWALSTGYPGTEMGVRSQMEEVLGKRASFLFDRMRHYFFHEEDIVFIKECGRIPYGCH